MAFRNANEVKPLRSQSIERFHSSNDNRWHHHRPCLAALVLPTANTEAMLLHLNEISKYVASKAHAVVLMDRAGWHTTGKLVMPKNLTIILLASKSPELNPNENTWQYLRANHLSNRVFETYDDGHREQQKSGSIFHRAQFDLIEFYNVLSWLVVTILPELELHA